MACSKWCVTEIKYSKTLQSQNNKNEIKASFNFAVILRKMGPERKFNPPFTPLLRLGTGE